MANAADSGSLGRACNTEQELGVDKPMFAAGNGAVRPADHRDLPSLAVDRRIH